MKTLIMTLSIAGCISAANAQQLQSPPKTEMLPEAKVPQWQKSFDDSMQLARSKSTTLTAVAPAKKLRAVVLADQIQPQGKIPQWKKSFNDSMRLGKAKPKKFNVIVTEKRLSPIDFTDHMPVAKPTNTDKKMPVIKTDRTGYKMPIAGKSDSTSNIITTPVDRKKP